MKEVTVLYCEVKYLVCPYCDAREEGWIGDPSGSVEKCESCGEQYSISQHADLEMAS